MNVIEGLNRSGKLFLHANRKEFARIIQQEIRLAPQVEIAGEEHLVDLNERLTDGYTSAVLVSNHLDDTDTLLLHQYIIDPYLPSRNEMGWLATSRMNPVFYYTKGRLTGEEREANSQVMQYHRKRSRVIYPLMRQFARNMNVREFYVVQGKDALDKNKPKHFRPIDNRIIRNTFQSFNQFLRNPGNVGGIYIEGGRSHDGTLQNPSSLFRTTIEDTELKDTLYVPVTIEGSQELVKNYFFGGDLSVHIAIGKPLTQRTILEARQRRGFFPEEILMVHIAAGLEDTDRLGSFSSEKYSDYLTECKRNSR